jgi:prolyl 4-hydroxylase
MLKEDQLPASWHEWIRTNVVRGCARDDMVAAMVNGGIDQALAQRSIEKFLVPAATATASTQPMVDLDVAVAAKSPIAYAYDVPRFPLQSNVLKTADREVRVVLRLEQPVVAVLDNLLSDAECDELVRLSRIKLKRSTIVDPQTGREEVITDRSSSGTFFMRDETEFIALLDRRIAQVMHWPVENGEGLQILHYSLGGEYKPHYDYFSPADTGSQLHLARSGQRVSTMVIYLNDVQAGGETVFPTLKLSVVPKKGSAVYFEYCNSLGQIDPQTLHGGQPVTQGEKWIATKWMRQRPYG